VTIHIQSYILVGFMFIINENVLEEHTTKIIHLW
jgi:hypothetical protein